MGTRWNEKSRIELQCSRQGSKPACGPIFLTGPPASAMRPIKQQPARSWPENLRKLEESGTNRMNWVDVAVAL